MASERDYTVIGACAVLHNIAVLLNEPMDDPLDNPEEMEPDNGTERHYFTGVVLR